MQLSYKIIKNPALSSEKTYLKEIGAFQDTDSSCLQSNPIIEEKPEEAIDSANADIEAEKTAAQIWEKSKQDGYAEGFRAGKEDGYQEGFEKGINEGLSHAREEAEKIRAEAMAMFEDAEMKVLDYYKTSENQILKLAIELAENITHETISSGSDNIMSMVTPALHEYGKSEKVIIRTNPLNVSYVKGHLHQIEKLCPSARLIVIEDPEIEENGAVIENENQITDLQISSQLKKFLQIVNQ